MSFIRLRVRTATIVHGYTDRNEEIAETLDDQAFADKLIAISRIQSATEQFLLVTGSHGRVMYWEYEGSLDALAQRLAAAGLVIA